jgi:2-polyprenyl-6-methoxyphenol hydroxylase-like FAD-dependent oxidoreductase
MADYDIITIGGGLAGASLAKVMADRGRRVLVLEREARFRDRVRGEQMSSWGTAEARELGILDLLLSTCARESPVFDAYIGPIQIMHRDLAATTPSALPNIAFFHPAMQETLIAAAADAGAEVQRGVRVTGIECGAGDPAVAFYRGGGAQRASARMVVAADGRNSAARAWCGFQTQDERPRLQLTGLLFEDVAAEPGFEIRFQPDSGRATFLCPQGQGRLRTYLSTRVDSGERLSGEAALPRYIEQCTEVGIPADLFASARPSWPLATFDGADSWVEQPYRDGVALIGDAAATSDPSWGQGLSCTLRDVRLLRDALLASDDIDAAGRAYAEAHDRSFRILRETEDLFTTLFHEVGPEAEARRARVLPLVATQQIELPDAFQSAPDEEIAESVRELVFGAPASA